MLAKDEEYPLTADTVSSPTAWVIPLTPSGNWVK